MNSSVANLVLPFSIHAKILSNIEKHLPEEACGLLSGRGVQVRHHFTVTNMLHSPVRFQMGGSEMLKAFDWMEKHNQLLLAIYHSHPDGPDEPSQADFEEDYYPGVIKLIGSMAATKWVLKAFIMNNSGYLLIPIVINKR